ncbi:MAG: LysM peptidoglycan-binding domain-containing protein [Alistipes sp.]|nr:LysM peptidoglycan-binding domain-containing protein [Alistipes sp.]
MKRPLLVTLISLFMVSAAMAIEPSNILVTLNGKAYYKHAVERGQTLYAIAKAYNVSEEQIMACNEGLKPETLKADEYILIPRTIADTKEQKAATTTPQSPDKKKFLVHTVVKGDTLYSIARKYKISIAQLERDNPDLDIDNLAIDDTILIRRAERGYASSDDIERELERRAERQAEVGEGEHRVVAGETIYTLSRRYGISEEEFMALNNLASPNDLKLGMVVRTKPVAEGVEPVAEGVAESAKESAVETAPAEEERRGARDRRRQRDEVEQPVDTIDYYDIIEPFMTTAVDIKPVEVAFPPLSMHHTLNVALMLPFHMNNKVNPYFVDFYRGVLLAMEDLKEQGYDISLSVFDTMGSGERIGDIISYEDGLRDAQLIIGPVYEGELRYVVGYAEENEIPVVSPLADINSLQSPVLFQMQAEGSHKTEKLANIFDGSREVVMIYANTTDADFEREMLALAANAPVTALNYKFERESFFYERTAGGGSGAQIDIVEFMRTPSKKAYVVVAKEDTDVDRILTTLASTKASVVARSMSYGDYVVVGNRKWKQSATIEKQSFFRNNTIFVVPYYANRSDENIRIFDSRYVKAYNTLATMYAYRGYDAAMIFCRKMFEGIDGTIFDEHFKPLATPYHFVYEGGHYTNDTWIREHYTSNFTIVVE